MKPLVKEDNATWEPLAQKASFCLDTKSDVPINSLFCSQKERAITKVIKNAFDVGVSVSDDVGKPVAGKHLIQDGVQDGEQEIFAGGTIWSRNE